MGLQLGCDRWGEFVETTEREYLRRATSKDKNERNHGDLLAFGDQYESKLPGVKPNKGGLL